MEPSKEHITKDQHYVPQFYLRQWLSDAGKFYPIKIENKNPPKFKIFYTPSNPTNFCFEKFFYAQYTGVRDEMSQTVEKLFSNLEGIFSGEILKIEKKIIKREEILDYEKYILAQFMIFIHLRGKKYLDQSKDMLDGIMKDMLKKWVHFMDKSPDSKKRMDESGITKEEVAAYINKGEFKVEFGNATHLQIMEDMNNFANILFHKYWKVFISTKGEFITTDAPYLDLPMSKEIFGNDFLSREQTLILSPRVMIAALDPKSEGGKKFVRKDITGNKDFIQNINKRNFGFAIRFGFHKDREILVDLERRIQESLQRKP